MVLLYFSLHDKIVINRKSPKVHSTFPSQSFIISVLTHPIPTPDKNTRRLGAIEQE